MGREFSLYLDICRFFAAVLVFLSHAYSFSGGFLWQLGGLGHEAVVFFFMLSGFVIGYVCLERQENWHHYIVNRLVRIFSVVIPALFITILVYLLLQLYAASRHQALFSSFSPFLTTLMHAVTFTNQTWIATKVWVNQPYWSMSYEVLYYIFFGIVFYVRGWRRIFFASLILLLMGPSILLYLPIWFAGYYCFVCKDKIVLSKYMACSGVVISIIMITVGFYEPFHKNLNGLFAEYNFYSHLLEPAYKFFADYYLACWLFLHFICIYNLCKCIKVDISNKVENIIRYSSSHTFSLYLLHMPLLYAAQLFFPFEQSPVASVMSVFVVVPVLILMISHYIEGNRHKMRGLLLNHSSRWLKQYPTK